MNANFSTIAHARERERERERFTRIISIAKVTFIFQNTTITVKVRNDKDESDLEKQADCLKAKYKANIVYIPGEKVDISSKSIREIVSKNEPISHLVPEKVAEYIKVNNLYRAN